MSTLTDPQRALLEALRTRRDVTRYRYLGPGFESPTNLAMLCWPETQRHSAYASPILKKLANEGFVERGRGGKYRITDAGLRALEVGHG